MVYLIIYNKHLMISRRAYARADAKLNKIPSTEVCYYKPITY